MHRAGTSATCPFSAGGRSTRPRRPISLHLARLVGPAALGLAAASLLGGAGCGGTAVVDPEVEATTSSGGTGGTGTTTTSSSSTGAGGTGGTGGSVGGGGEGGAPPILALVEDDLGTVAEGEEILFDVEPGTLGMTAVALRGGFDWVGIRTITAPNDNAIVQNYGMAGTSAYYESYGAITALVPQSDHPEAMPLMNGQWAFEVTTDSPSNMIDLSIWTRRTVDGQFHGGVIDINVFLVPSVSEEFYMETLMENAFGDYAGLEVGHITFYPLSEQFAVLDENNVIELFMQSDVAPTIPALNVYAVGNLTGMFDGAGGFTLGAPALPLVHGTLQSGLVMMVFDSFEIDSLVVRHEAGHLAGLYHTSEIDPVGYGDALDDTPLCPNVEQMLYNCPDVDNLMFPYGGVGDATDLSPKQIRVIQASALYRGRVEEGGAPAIPIPADGLSSDGESAADGEPQQGGTQASTPAHLPHDLSRSASGPVLEQPWAQGLPPAVAAFLTAHWEYGHGLPDPFDMLRRLGGAQPQALWSLATDERAPAHVRMRALLALGHLAPGKAPRAELAALAERSNEHRLVRLGALGALTADSPADARAVAHRLVADGDGVIARAAQRLR